MGGWAGEHEWPFARAGGWWISVRYWFGDQNSAIAARAGDDPNGAAIVKLGAGSDHFVGRKNDNFRFSAGVGVGSNQRGSRNTRSATMLRSIKWNSSRSATRRSTRGSKSYYNADRPEFAKHIGRLVAPSRAELEGGAL